MSLRLQCMQIAAEVKRRPQMGWPLEPGPGDKIDQK